MSLLSKPIWLTHECAQYKHPWTNSCIDANRELFLSAIKYSLKFYSILYVGSLALKGRIFSTKKWKETIHAILQSSLFLSVHVLCTLGFICVARNMFGGANVFTAIHFPTLVSCILTFWLERPARRKFLGIYLANFACESLFNVAVDRGIIRPIANGTTYMFMLSTAALMYVYKSIKCKDPTMTALRFIVGPNEEYNYNNDLSARMKQRRTARLHAFAKVNNYLTHLLKPVTDRLKDQARHESCPHRFSCVHYVVHGTGKMFAFGCVLKAALTLVFQLTKIVQRPSILPSLLFNKNMFNLAMFFGSFAGIARLTSCLLRWVTNKDSKYHGFIAGLLAGGVSFYPFSNKTFAQYAMWKALEVIHDTAVNKKLIPSIPGGSFILFCLAMPYLFHAVFFEKQSVRPSYFKFLDDLLNGRMKCMHSAFKETFGEGGAMLKAVAC